MNRVMAFAAGALFASAAWAQNGYNWADFENVRVWARVSIPGVSDGDPISGTNVNTGLGAGAGPNPDWSQWYSVYYDAQFYRARLTMNGEQLYDRVYPYPPPGGGSGVGGFSFGMMGGEPEPWQYPQQYAPPGVRFASNHFPHNSSVAIVLECWFKLYRADGGLDDGYVVATLTPKAYNKLAAWKTTVTVPDGDPWPGLFQGYIDGMVTLGAGQFAQANYGPDNDHVKNVPAALAALDVSTGVFINTHGNGGGIAQTAGWNPSYEGHWLGWDEISGVTAGQPPHSWLILYVCNSIYWAGSVNPAFRLAPMDAIHLGFDVPIMPVAENMSDPNDVQGFKIHAERLFLFLGAGYKAEVAVVMTNLLWRPWDAETLEPVEMRWSGDGRTTWTSVYLSDEERAAYGDEGGDLRNGSSS